MISPANPARIEASAMTDIGCVRSNNEDALALSEPTQKLWWGVVCDGMGGAAAGEVASGIAARMMRSLLERLGASLPDSQHLADGIAAINDAILDEARRKPDMHGMGTTMAALLLDPATLKARVIHTGDARVYLFRAGDLFQLTCDHNVGEELIRMGRIDRSVVAQLANSASITRCLGMDDFPGPEIAELAVEIRDRLLICSDGLSNFVSTSRMKAALAEAKTGDAARALISAAIDQEAPDNVTVIVADVCA